MNHLFRMVLGMLPVLLGLGLFPRTTLFLSVILATYIVGAEIEIRTGFWKLMEEKE